MKVKEKYRGLSREELLIAIERLGADYEVHSYSCSQCILAAINDVVGLSDDIVRCGTSSCGGSAFQLVGPCGGYQGGLIALDYFFGRPAKCMSPDELKMENIQKLMDSVAVAREWYDKYFRTYGTIQCAGIMYQKFGRLFYFEDPDEFRKFDEAGAHTDPEKCAKVVGTAARMLLELLMDKGVVEAD
jgi:hypothetical protein